METRELSTSILFTSFTTRLEFLCLSAKPLDVFNDFLYFQGPSSATPSGSLSYEPDILEEDLDDSPYTPYSYPKKAKAKKGKGMKK